MYFTIFIISGLASCVILKFITIKHIKVVSIIQNLHLHVNLQPIINIAEMRVLDG
jgi:hypothetical protein